MKKYSVLFAIFTLVLASLACQTLMGGGKGVAPVPPSGGGVNPPQLPTAPVIPGLPTVPPIATDSNGNITIGGESEFPMPADATDVVNMGNQLLTFQTKLNMDEAMKFYRDEFDKLGYTERTADTFTSSAFFTMFFDGHKSGKVIMIQGFDMGADGLNMSIALTDN